MDPGTTVGVVALGLQVLEGVISYYSAYKDYGDDALSALRLPLLSRRSTSSSDNWSQRPAYQSKFERTF
jgi:hypothetical protein